MQLPPNDLAVQSLLYNVQELQTYEILGSKIPKKFHKMFWYYHSPLPHTKHGSKINLLFLHPCNVLVCVAHEVDKTAMCCRGKNDQRSTGQLSTEQLDTD